MDLYKKDWFTDKEDYDQHCFSLKSEEILYQGKSKYQDILIFRNAKFGNVLCLDGRIQDTELDEHCYQEMITFLPLNSHPNPEKVLIIGGGDGGVARECDKHPLVKKVVQCEIDEEVCNVSKLYLPEMGKGFDSKKLELHIGDGFEFLKNHKNEFDVIICDSSDNKGPAECLWNAPFYRLMKNSLRANGIVSCQGEDNWYYKEIVSNVINFAGDIFPSVSYALGRVPAFPAGTCGYILCSMEPNKIFSKPIHEFDEETADKMGLRYYSSKVHEASFTMPTKFKKLLKKSSKNYTV